VKPKEINIFANNTVYLRTKGPYHCIPQKETDPKIREAAPISYPLLKATLDDPTQFFW